MQSKDFFIQWLKQVRNIVYAGLEASKKDCLCKGLKIVYRLPEQGNKYNIPHLKVSLEAIFSEMVWANKIVFIFRQGNCTMNILHPSLSKSFALSICSRDPMKDSTLGYFCKSTYSQMHRKLQSWWLFGRWLLCSVLQVEISYLHITSHILFANIR